MQKKATWQKEKTKHFNQGLEDEMSRHTFSRAGKSKTSVPLKAGEGIGQTKKQQNPTKIVTCRGQGDEGLGRQQGISKEAPS